MAVHAPLWQSMGVDDDDEDDDGGGNGNGNGNGNGEAVHSPMALHVNPMQCMALGGSPWESTTTT